MHGLKGRPANNKGKPSPLRGSNDDIDEVNRARRLVGLGPIIIKERPCLRCGSMFEARGANNRMCTRCRDARFSGYNL